MAEPEEEVGLGIHVISGEALLGLLRRVAEGADPDWLYAETYVNAVHIRSKREEEGDD